MSTESARVRTDELQFDVAETDHAADASDGVSCARCSRELHEYYHVDGATMCDSCRDRTLSDAAPERSWAKLAGSALLGLGAAIAGAIVYYGVIALTNFEIGIVAILIGFMVGWAVRKGAGGRGGRRFQILAIALTYFAVALAYSPLAMKSMFDQAKQPVASDSTKAVVGAATSAGASTTVDTVTVTPGAQAKAEMPSGSALAVAIGALLLLVLSLPVLVVVGSMPSGILSAIIIGIGLHQAWKMTGAPKVSVTGPYQVGTAESSAPA